jgi:hypothetical protein
MTIAMSIVTLRSGEQVSATTVRAPDSEWASRLEVMLQHKGDPWNWQNSELLRCNVGLEARFFVLHRSAAPFANIMLIETAGVGILGHVWTEPADRGGGASSILMDMLLRDFQTRGGRTLFLGTEYNSDPWHYYHRRGFKPVEPASGYMVLYLQSPEDFALTWFRAADAVVEPLDWPHWPSSVPLFLGAFPGAVRIAATQLIGRRSPEGPMLPILREERRRQTASEPGSARVLRAADGAAVLGFASWHADSFWPEGHVVDLYCHPQWWHRADELLAALPWPKTGRLVAYADADLVPKRAALERFGFKSVALLPRWVAVDAARMSFADVAVYARA